MLGARLGALLGAAGAAVLMALAMEPYTLGTGAGSSSTTSTSFSVSSSVHSASMDLTCSRIRVTFSSQEAVSHIFSPVMYSRDTKGGRAYGTQYNPYAVVPGYGALLPTPPAPCRQWHWIVSAARCPKTTPQCANAASAARRVLFIPQVAATIALMLGDCRVYAALASTCTRAQSSLRGALAGRRLMIGRPQALWERAHRGLWPFVPQCQWSGDAVAKAGLGTLGHHICVLAQFPGGDLVLVACCRGGPVRPDRSRKYIVTSAMGAPGAPAPKERLVLFPCKSSRSGALHLYARAASTSQMQIMFVGQPGEVGPLPVPGPVCDQCIVRL